jgi:hypothetical protein
LHLTNSLHSTANPVAGLFVQFAFVFHLEQLNESANAAQWGLQIVGRYIGELLQLDVASL